MTMSFKLNAPLDRDYNADFQDTLMIKRALNALGYYQTPAYGMTQYPDELLFKGIEGFQRDFGLKKDGLMMPGGETERTIRSVIGSAGNGATGMFVSTVAVVDAAVVAHAAAAVASTVVVYASTPDEDGGRWT